MLQTMFYILKYLVFWSKLMRSVMLSFINCVKYFPNISLSSAKQFLSCGPNSWLLC